ncbi:hypothetical protein BGW37DRAFT_488576 [Umbelopsis sp. PMI_123]|nr:hypothetical protein BGW37DRAFT_488576 [Umbelopsis sp. PMI_123]
MTKKFPYMAKVAAFIFAISNANISLFISLYHTSIWTRTKPTKETNNKTRSNFHPYLLLVWTLARTLSFKKCTKKNK